jgi:hypothetical protein
MLAAREHDDAVSLQAACRRIVRDRVGKDDEAAEERKQGSCHGSGEILASACHDTSPTVAPRRGHGRRPTTIADLDAPVTHGHSWRKQFFQVVGKARLGVNA